MHLQKSYQVFCLPHDLRPIYIVFIIAVRMGIWQECTECHGSSVCAHSEGDYSDTGNHCHTYHVLIWCQ